MRDDIIKPFRIVAIIMTIVAGVFSLFTVVSVLLVNFALNQSYNESNQSFLIGVLVVGIELLIVVAWFALCFSFLGIVAGFLDAFKNQKKISFIFIVLNSVEFIAMLSAIGYYIHL